MIAMLLAAAMQNAAPAFPADGTYTYVSTLGGQNAGTSSISVTRNGSSIQVVENASGTVNGTTSTAKATMSLAGADLAPASYAGNYVTGGSPMHVEVAINGATAKVSGSGGTVPPMSLVGDAKHFVIVEIGLANGLFALPAQMAAWQNPPTILVVPALGQGVPTTVQSLPAAQRPKTVPATDAGIQVTAGPQQLMEWYDPTTMLVDEIDVPSQNLVVTRQTSPAK